MIQLHILCFPLSSKQGTNPKLKIEGDLRVLPLFYNFSFYVMHVLSVAKHFHLRDEIWKYVSTSCYFNSEQYIWLYNKLF